MKSLPLLLTIALISTPVLATESCNVEIVKQPESSWHFRNISAHTTGDSTHIRGRLTALNPVGLPRGHVDIAAYSPTGELITETTASYTPALLTRTTRHNGGARFSTDFDNSLPEGSTVKVAFHRDEVLPQSSPVHAVNIAR